MDKVISTLESILKLIVTHPESIELFASIETDDNGELDVINVKVHREDVGACIGKSGSTAEALRKVIGLAGWTQLQRRVYVRIDAPKVPKNHFEFEAK